MEARNRPLHDWLNRVRLCQIRLPRFQRAEAWGYRDVESLLQTVIRQLPAGSVLTLEVGQEEPFVSRTMVGAPTMGDRANEHLLDGQQRLTALWRSLNDNYDDRRFFVSMEPDVEIGGPYSIISVPRYIKDEKLYPLWMNDPTKIWEKKLIPVSLLRPDQTGETESKAWAKNASPASADERIKIIEHINDLRNKFANFNIPFLSLPITTPSEIALDVFIKMNTSSVPLTPFDIIVAQAEAETGESLHDLLKALQTEIPDLAKLADPADVVLAVAALLNNQPPVRKSFSSKGFASSIVNNWQRIKRGIEQAIQLLHDEKVFDEKRLPSDLALYVLSAVWANAPTKVDAVGELRILSRRYIWHAFLTQRYEKTASTRALVDFRQLRDRAAGAVGIGSAENIDIFNKTEYPLPDLSDILTAGWPAKKERLARTIILLTFQAGAFDFADGGQITARNCDSREYHHVFPVATLEANFSTGEINRALNCALISQPTNRTISAKSPTQYLRDRMGSTASDDKEIRRKIESHLLPYDATLAADYEKFINTRAKLLIDEISNFVGRLG